MAETKEPERDPWLHPMEPQPGVVQTTPEPEKEPEPKKSPKKAS